MRVAAERVVRVCAIEALANAAFQTMSFDIEAEGTKEEAEEAEEAEEEEEAELVSGGGAEMAVSTASISARIFLVNSEPITGQ
jgi:hypothetical protein